MKKWFIFTILVTVLLFFVPGNLSTGWAEAEDHSVLAGQHIQKSKDFPQIVGKRRIDKDFGNIPLYFIPNKGQMNEKALFCAKTHRYSLWLTKQGLVFDSISPPSGHPSQEGSHPFPHSPKPGRDVSRLIFLNANKQPVVVPEKPTNHRVNYFKGKDKSRWYTDIPTSKVVRYKDLYKNIDLKVYGIGKQIEYDWVVKPGGDPGNIQFQHRGVKEVSIDEKGNLVVQTAFGKWLHKKPLAYQVIEGRKLEVEAAFAIQNQGKNQYGFRVGSYDKAHELIIDPLVLVQSGFLGSSGDDGAVAMAIDASGYLYVAGWAGGPNFPTASAYQPSHGGNWDGFITKLTPDGSGLVFSTYLGGGGQDYALKIVLGSGGLIYIAGSASSTDFPTVNPYQAVLGGYSDAFAAIFSADGSGLLYSTYLGGSYTDYCYGLGVTPAGEICLGGTTFSNDFPVYNAYDASFGGISNDYSDAFLTKFNASGDALVFSTYLGNSGDQQGSSLVIASNGDIYLAGSTFSSDFPVSSQAYQTSFGGQSDGFISRFTSTGALDASTLYGGSSYDSIADIALDSSDYLYIVRNYGNSMSTADSNAIVVKFNNIVAPSGHMAYSKYLGDSSAASAITVDSGGKAYITGRTLSPTFPVPNAFQDTIAGGEDAFVLVLSADGSTVDKASFLGGTDNDRGNEIFVDASGSIYVCGDTWSPSFPTYQGFQMTHAGLRDGFVCKIDDVASPITLTTPNGGEDLEVGTYYDITWNNAGFIANVRLEYSTDSGANWEVIEDPVANTGIYSWVVPDAPSTTCLVKVSDSAGPPTDSSDGFFTISSTSSSLTLTAPNGGESWSVGSTYNITWTFSGAITNVNIDYSTDNGGLWTSIVMSTPNTGSYDWTIPGIPSNECLVRVSDESGTPTDTSDAVFTIISSPFPSAERNALIALYNSTNGDSWTMKDNWRKPGDPTQFNDPGTECTWYGVTCSGDHVFRIILNNNNLNGTIPDLSALTELDNLNLRDNQLSGTIPASLASLPKLKFLALDGNNLESPLPDLSGLPLLSYLYLDENNFTGSIPAWLTNCGNLTYLYLDNNSFSGALPDLSGLTSIKSLVLDDNLLTGPIPAWLNNLVTLDTISFNRNQFTGSIPDLSSLSVLRYFSLSDNQLTGSIPAWMTTHNVLAMINLENNQLSGTIPDLSNVTNLFDLRLSDNAFTGPIPNLAGLATLYRLKLSNNQLSGSIPGELGQLTAIGNLSLNGNQLTGSIPTSLSNLTTLVNSNSDFGWNGLYTDDQGLRDFLNSKQIGGDWESTQTIAPTGVSTSEVTENSIMVSWTPITYQGDSGGYNVYYSTTSGSGYTLAGATADKTVDNYTVTNLAPNTTYYFVVETFTNSHADNQNTVTSEYSAEVSAITLVEPTLTVTVPNSGETWEGNYSQDITWNSTGAIASVKIEYSTDNGGLWNTVTDSTPNSGSYTWTVPNTPSTTCLVKISDTAGPASDVSDTVFTIVEQRTITVTAPNNGEDWMVGSSQDITWMTTGSIGTVSIDYSTDGGGLWNSIVSITGNTGTYNWTIPDDQSNNCLVRISDTAGPAADTSDAVFTISPPRISQLQRDALIALYNSTNGDSWNNNSNWRKPGDPAQFNDPGTEHTWYGVTCNAQRTNVIQIDLSVNGLIGTIPDLNALTQLELLNLGTNQVSGPIPTSLNNLTNLTTLKLEVNQLNGTIPDLSNLTNLVELDLSLNELTGTIPSHLNNLVNLKWLYLSRNQLNDVIPDLSNLTQLEYLYLNDNQLTGSIPAHLNNLTTLVRLHLHNNQLSGNITVLSNLTQLTHLNLNNNQLTGSIPDWFNNLTNLEGLYLMANNFSGVIPDLSNLTQLLHFAAGYNNLTGGLANLANLTQLLSIYLSNNQLSGSIPSELGNLTNLSILRLQGNQLTGEIPGTLSNITNLGNEELNIKWNSLYTTNSGLRDFLNSKQEGGDWESTQTIAPTDVSTSDESHDSVKVFWTPIQYQADAGGYRIYYSTTSGSGYILAGSADDKSLDNYTVTGLEASTTYYFLVEAFTTPHIYNLNQVVSEYSTEVSTTTLELPTITVSAPNGGQSWEAFTSQVISWNSTGNITDVKIEYSTDNGGLWNTIVASTPNNGTYDWTVPNTPSTNCLVKITDVGGVAEDSSDAVFTIAEQRTITVTAPNGTENWEGGTNHNITWTSTGSIANVKIEYSTDNGGLWNTVVASTSNSGSYNWTVPNTPSSSCLVRISDTAGPASDVSNAAFTIAEQRTITVTAPNGSENWEGGTNQNITWISTGTIANVNIEYSTDNGGLWNTVVASTANSGSYNWTVPNTPSSTCLVRISDIAGPASDISNAAFTIAEQRTIAVIAPNGGESWRAETTQTITWSSTGNIVEVRLEYSSDGGSLWNTIVSATANSGNYSWEVPDDPSDNCLVKISDTSGPAWDDSDAVFSITPPAIPSTERDALIALYNNTDGDNWNDNTNWRKPGDPTQFNDPGTEHTWYGVTCDAQNTHVEGINLFNNGLTGTIPVDLNNLAELTTLNLSWNQLTGTIPTLGSLTILTSLNFSGNQLTGNIPAWINNLTLLTSLHLAHNQLSGAIPDLGNLISLTGLNLSTNQLTGTIPAWINNFVNLTTLDLQSNQLTGAIPDLGNLTNLTFLSFDNNQLSGNIPTWINDFTQLTNLHLAFNQLTGGIPDLSSLVQLTSLDLSYNQLTGTIPTSLGTLTALTSLRLNENQLQGNITPELGNLTALRYLYLDANQLEGSIPSELGNLADLNYLYLKSNQFIGSIPGALSNLTNLNSDGLELRWNGLYTADTDLRDFLNSKQNGGDWESTQTIAPTGLSTSEQTHDSVKVSWNPIQYQSNSGGYRVYYSTTSGSGYTLAGTTADKTVDNYIVIDLTPNTTYYFVVETFTDVHSYNDNTVTSQYSTEVSASTLEEPTLAITAPNGGQSWEALTSQVITWNSTGNITDVKIEYSTNNGGSWSTVIASTPNNGNYNWTVPNTPSTDCLVKIADIGGLAEDTSDAVFTIAEQRTLTVTAPNGTENWESGTNQNITWNSTGSIANVKIEYSTDNGGLWNTVAASTPDSGSYNWTVPNTPSSTCLVRISDTAGPASDVSNAAFTIAEQRTITVTAPNGTENWEGGFNQNITWNSTGSIANVKIEYSTNNGGAWDTVAASATNNGSYNWTVPNTPSSECLVKISDTAGPASDTSNAVFTIAQQRTLTVTTPNGTENWEGGFNQNITWNSTGSIANVKIEYSTDNGSLWNTVAASTANDGNHSWTVPNTPSSNCLVRISDTAGSASDTSNAVFTILEQRTVTVNAPNGGQRWFIDSNYSVTWTTTGSIANVMIEYSTNGGGSWSTIVSSTTNSSSYNWTIPNTPSTDCLVRISDTAGPAQDVSNGVFTIDPYPTITVTSPNGGQSWVEGTTQNITWTYTGTIANVEIEYSTNGGISWNSIVSSTANTGSYNWVIPAEESGNCLVRVSDTATTASDASDAVFTLWKQPSITVTTPNGGESWKRFTIQTIGWNTTGNIQNVKIQYSKNAGGNWIDVVTSTPNDGSYQWNVPNVNKNKTQCLVKIMTLDGTVVDTSDNYFTISKF